MKTIAVSGLFVSLCVTSLLMAQELPKFAEPQKEHAWLRQFVGEWVIDSEGPAGPGQPSIKCTGTMSSRALGGFWVVSELKSEIMGMPMTAIQTVGYDPEAKKYIGTWVDTMMNYLWKYDGSVDKSGKILTLEAEGPDFAAPGNQKLSKYRDVYEFKSPDHIVQTSSVLTAEGKWTTFMTGNMRRKK